MFRSSKLTADFEGLSSDLFEGMNRVHESLNDETAILELDTEGWYCSNTNCYNFALNRQTDGFLQPGKISGTYEGKTPRYSLKSYSDNVIDRSQSDGLRYLGKHFSEAIKELSERENLVALFFKDGDFDFHWFSFRKQWDAEKKEPSYAWAHKRGRYPARVCSNMFKGTDLTNIFSEAQSCHYNNFAGFYAAPKSLEKISCN